MLIEFKKTFCNKISGAPLHHLCAKKCATMDHEGPSMSVIIYIDHQLTQPLMFTSIPGVERRRFAQVVSSVLAARNGVSPFWSGHNSSVNIYMAMQKLLVMAVKEGEEGYEG